MSSESPANSSRHPNAKPGAAVNPVAAASAIAADIKLAHSVFALPFAVLAMFLAAAYDPTSTGRWPTWTEAMLIVICMVAARTVAMTMNRWADAHLDRANPRTTGRAIPAGRVSRRSMLAAAIGSAALFFIACAAFGWANANWWPLILSPVVLAWLVGYSFAKRFTALCHLWLGVALGLSPVAAAIAIDPSYLSAANAPVWLLAGYVAAWVAGFDILYALQDVEVDRRDGLFSIPSRLGVEGALWTSRVLHVLCAAALAGVYLSASPLAKSPVQLFAIAAVITTALLVYEHLVVARRGTAGVPMVFLSINGVISILLGIAGITDITAQ